MGKVLGRFTNGYTGAASRSIDNIIVAFKNASEEDIPFGAPVFLKDGEASCLPFAAATSTAEAFLGFAVRVPDKTPEVYGSNEAVFKAGDLAEVLVRGSAVLQFGGAVTPGSSVYIRKSDGVLVTEAGESGTTLQIPNATVRSASDSQFHAEVVLTKRNIM
ncbi:MAG: hypothetical protein K6E83_12445 [Clostridium sp.]|nr:hypothetical protein [Clostridium sp.]